MANLIGHSPCAKYCSSVLIWASLVAQKIKNLPAIQEVPLAQETRVCSLGQEDPLEKKMATLSSMIACEIPWTEEPGGLQSVSSQELDMIEHTHRHDHSHYFF